MKIADIFEDYTERSKLMQMCLDHFYADLVFYHVILKCYVIIDLKTRPITHGDLGQIQLYVNYFDEEIKQENDNPTIGLVLCTQKKDEMAKYLLGEGHYFSVKKTKQLNI